MVELASFFFCDSEKATQRKWAITNALKLVRDFQTSPNAFKFKPEVSMDSISEGERRNRAAAIISRVKPEHVSLIDREVEESFTNETKSIPAYLLGKHAIIP